MENPNYNPEGKKLTLQQHMKLQREWEEKQARKLEQNDGVRPGICSECGNSGFKLKAIRGIIERTCKKCGDVKEF